jgi:hypothetical protein
VIQKFSGNLSEKNFAKCKQSGVWLMFPSASYPHVSIEIKTEPYTKKVWAPKLSDAYRVFEFDAIHYSHSKDALRYNFTEVETGEFQADSAGGLLAKVAAAQVAEVLGYFGAKLIPGSRSKADEGTSWRSRTDFKDSSWSWKAKEHTHIAPAAVKAEVDAGRLRTGQRVTINSDPYWIEAQNNLGRVLVWPVLAGG